MDIRRSLATTISAKFMLCKAKSYAHIMLLEMRRTGISEPMPDINYGWLSRFNRDKHIVYRLPNRRYKCSKATLIARLRAMWLNNIKVRYLATLTLGKDLADSLYGIDEKPIRFNEAGS